jgi:hypothetical protein
MNSDFGVLILVGKLKKLSTTFSTVRFVEKAVIAVEFVVGVNLFLTQNFLSSLYFGVNISSSLYSK